MDFEDILDIILEDDIVLFVNDTEQEYYISKDDDKLEELLDEVEVTVTSINSLVVKIGVYKIPTICINIDVDDIKLLEVKLEEREF